MTEVSNVGEGATELQLGSPTKPVEQGRKGKTGNNDNFLQIEVSSANFTVYFLRIESTLLF